MPNKFEIAVAKCIANTAAKYPNFRLPIGDDLIAMNKAYVSHLSNVSEVVLGAAFEIASQRSPDFFPPAPAVLAAADYIAAGRRRSGVEAWGDVVEKMCAIGSYGNPVFSDPVVGRIVRGMGWRNLCLSEDTMVDRAHFIKAYEQASAAAREEGAVALLPSAGRVIEETRRLADAMRAPARLGSGK